MNNGVVNNQNEQNTETTLIPVNQMMTTTAPSAPTQIPSNTQTYIQPSPPATVPATPSVVAPTPIMNQTQNLSQTQVATAEAPTVTSSEQIENSVELPSMKVDPEIEKKQEEKKKKKEKKEKKQKEVDPNAPPKQKKSSLPSLLFLLMVAFAGYVFYSNNNYSRTVTELNYRCSPINESKEEVELDVNSVLVQDLYQKVQTSIREDVAQPEWNNTMKLYLAFRQISDYEMYDSNCNMFSNGRMEPYTCEVSINFLPKAFKVSTLELEWKKMYGESTPMPYINVKLENSCIGGFQYVPEREEYVQGYCKQPTATSYRVTKKLVKATSSRNTIVLVEDVTYAGNEKLELPSYLKSGTYYYTFRLDMNYNYILLAKTYEEKY